MQIQQSPSFDGRDTTVIVLRLYTTTEDFKSNNYNVTTTFIRIPPFLDWTWVCSILEKKNIFEQMKLRWICTRMMGRRRKAAHNLKPTTFSAKLSRALHSANGQRQTAKASQWPDLSPKEHAFHLLNTKLKKVRLISREEAQHLVISMGSRLQAVTTKNLHTSA